MNRKELMQKLEKLNILFTVKDSTKRLQAKLDSNKTVAVKAFTLLKDGSLQTGGVGGSKLTVFEVGKTYAIDNEKPLELCSNGFHFYKTRNACFGSDLFGPNTVLHKIIAYGEVIDDTEKCVARKLKVCERVELELDDKSNSGDFNSGDFNSGGVNSGDRNSGYSNSGYSNSGDSNSGDFNSGYSNSGYSNSGGFNSGNFNSGYSNSGYSNSGDFNSGYRNSGHSNSGDFNSGDFNSGDFNSGYRNSGHYNSGNGYRNYFCEETKYFLFDIEVPRSIIEMFNGIDMSWFSLENKTYQKAWKECPESVLAEFRAIQEFQTEEAKEKFKRITGLVL